MSELTAAETRLRQLRDEIIQASIVTSNNGCSRCLTFCVVTVEGVTFPCPSCNGKGFHSSSFPAFEIYSLVVASLSQQMNILHARRLFGLDDSITRASLRLFSGRGDASECHKHATEFLDGKLKSIGAGLIDWRCLDGSFFSPVHTLCRLFQVVSLIEEHHIDKVFDWEVLYPKSG